MLAAKRTATFTESVIREMTRIANQHEAINLAQGFPDFPMPEPMKEAACAAINGDINQYAVTWGSAALPQVTAYWLMSPLIAAHAASFIGSGIGKSGNPCARLIASCWLAIRVISRITDSVNVAVLLAASISHLGKSFTNEIGRAHRSATGIERCLHRALRVRSGVAEGH